MPPSSSFCHMPPMHMSPYLELLTHINLMSFERCISSKLFTQSAGSPFTNMTPFLCQRSYAHRQEREHMYICMHASWLHERMSARRFVKFRWACVVSHLHQHHFRIEFYGLRCLRLRERLSRGAAEHVGVFLVAHPKVDRVLEGVVHDIL